ncbi:sodium-dependent glucose transporter 1A-like protein [Leptotrombidium deliense]|uniref:Sodium-dependent glucose transporter 1A-like protein n=1 Tax=Leptotrombidium deliense TaxID=299467 RepID=A0A443RYE5_9ACAR|nr:sodium-dependent glucose transporter 1A-like protein [Leptotrombidium deliense]
MDENVRESNSRMEKLGISAIVIPQTLKDLEDMMQINTATISIMFSVRSVFYALGAVLLGWLFNKWNRQLLFALCMLIIAVTFVLTPILPKYEIFLALSCANGFAVGGVDTAANVLVLEMWGKKQ